ncbi:sigma-70 family RNA polymerase sigma factor [Phytoactinopolyspora alkaliphila]|uniref:Sigma-70 family RNA polymerase sigma factor n=1 Tax=Phytoactinopolyspora alkaliphila TaxID=1783498 RepID=A0A6N9YQV1_9ACTN|nr:sigma-70 family RNA polymerase sigma factor [Phytoactinopolyspora alkaliphila]NED97218.1 sigma-70 family RNA polymerase sigma factor [Phytoactinopolyspora alkaliphila]
MTTPAEAPSDAQLIAQTREGDMGAYDELYRRHYDDASRVARIVTNNSDEAQDVVSEAFTRVLTRLREGGGPDTELTPYLRTVVRRLAIDRHRSSQRDGQPTDQAILEILPRTDDPMARATDRELVRQAFETLPDRWQQVLWHTEIEGRSPASLASSLGSTPNAVAALAYRAREGLRQAYLAVNLSSDVRAECRPYAPKVAAYVRGTLSAQHTRAVTTHLSECAHCRERRDELLLLVSDLRGTLWPALLLPAVAGSAVFAGAAAASGAAVAGGGAAAAAGAGGGSVAATTVFAGAGAGASAGGGAMAGAGASTGGTGATAASGAAAASSSGSGGVLSVLSPGRLARMGGKTLAGAAGVVAAGVIVAGAYMMMNDGSSDDPVDRAAPPAATSEPSGGNPTSSESTPDAPSSPSSPDSSDEPTTDPSEPVTDELQAPGPYAPGQAPPDDQRLPVSNPEPRAPENPQTPDTRETPDDETDEPDDPTPDPETSPPPTDSDDESPPTVTNPPQTSTVEAGKPLTLQVNVSGSPTPSVIWQTRQASSASTSARAGGAFSAASGQGWSDVPGATSSSLTITPRSTDNGRQYRAVATNEFGSKTTDPTMLNVQFAPERITSPKPATVNEGGSVTFTAAASANPAPSSVTWQRRKGGGSWQSAGAGSMSQGTTATLELSGVDKSLHDYEYRAVFKNSVGEGNSNAASLTVYYLAQDVQTIEASLGSTAEFEAQISSNSVTARWQKREADGRWQEVKSTEGKPRVTLEVPVTKLEQDKTQYQVIFETPAGRITTSTAELRVHQPEGSAITIKGDTNEKYCVVRKTDENDGEFARGVELSKPASCADPPPYWSIYSVHDLADTTRPNGYVIRWARSGCLTRQQEGRESLALKPCSTDVSQRWHFGPRGLHGRQIKSEANEDQDVGRCLDVKGGSTQIRAGTEVIVWNCRSTDNRNQLFQIS